MIMDRLYAQGVSLRRDARIVTWTVVAVGLRQPLAINRRTGDITLRKRPSAGVAQPVETSSSRDARRDAAA